MKENGKRDKNENETIKKSETAKKGKGKPTKIERRNRDKANGQKG